jgi:hypothetical protein
MGCAVTKMRETVKCLEILRGKQLGRPRKERNNENMMDLGRNFLRV